MSESVAERVAASSLPGDPAGLHLTVTSEVGPALDGGRRQESHRLLVRRPRDGEVWRPAGAWSDGREHVGLVSVRRIPLVGASVAAAVLAELGRSDGLDVELNTAVLSAVVTSRGGRARLAPAVREVLGKGSRSVLGDLVVLDGFSVSGGWASAGLEVLLLGELMSRTVDGPSVVATAPFFLKGAQGYQPTLAALKAAGFRPLAGHVMVAECSGLPTLSGAAGKELIEQYRNGG